MWTTAEADLKPHQDPGALVTAQAIGVPALRVAPDAANRALREAADRYRVAAEALAAEVVATAGGLASRQPFTAHGHRFPLKTCERLSAPASRRPQRDREAPDVQDWWGGCVALLACPKCREEDV